MSRWGSTQTSAQWNTTTMTRVKVSLKTQFCHFLFSKASVFVPFFGMRMKLLITECLNVQGANTQWTKRKTRKLTAEKGICPSIPSVLLMRYRERSKSLHSYFQSKNVFLSPLFFLLLPILAPVSCICLSWPGSFDKTN